MRKSRLALTVALLVALALPLSASQFVELSFDQVVRGSSMIVRGTLGPVTSQWDAEGRVIFSSAPLTIDRYVAGQGPRVVMVREVGGTVNGYTQAAIGFPELREGEEVVLFLSRWEGSSDFRIHAFRQGKYVVSRGEGIRLQLDSQFQGESRLESPDTNAVTKSDMSMDFSEFESMVNAVVRAGERSTPQAQAAE